MALRSIAWPASGSPGIVARVGIASAATAQQEQRGAASGRRRRVERLRAVPQPADQEREAEHEQGVGQDRPDQGGLDDDDQPGLQGEDRDEQLREVAERRLEDARRGRPEALAELVRPLPDQRCERGQGDRADDEDDRLAGASAVEPEREDGRGNRDDRGRR